MGLFYAFVSLDEVQLKRRRELLDRYGQIAQFSALVPLLLVYISFLVRLLSNKYHFSIFERSRKAHQSPRVSTFKQSTAGAWKIKWRRLNWALDDEVLQGWNGWGTRREWAIAGVWALWLLVLVLKDTGDDYLHLTKRFGIVAASQLPLHYLLAAKSWSPLQHLTRMSHEELNPYHRLLGRILIALFSCHAALYINFYIQSNLLHRFGSQTVILGLTAITIFILLGTSSLAKIRDYSYLLFFVLHVALSIAILPVLWFHVSHLRVYIIESALIYILIIAQRNLSQTPTLATLSLSSQSHQPSLLSISFPVPRSKLRSYAPGQHIYLGLPPSSPLTKPWEKLRLNPFTIASVTDPLSSISTTASPAPTAPSAKTPQLTLLIRPLRSSTAILRSLALSSAKEQPIPVLVEGPYGSASYFPDLSAGGFGVVLLVAGGVGATFTLPIYRDLCRRRGGAGEGGVRMVWSVRGREEARWGLEMLGGEGREGMDVYVTGQGAGRGTRREASEGGDGDGDGDVELEEQVGLLGGAGDDGEDLNTKDMIIHQGRPDLRAIVQEVFEQHRNGKMAVLVCGPSGMGKALRKEVGVWVGRGTEVFWHAEEFGW